ncbi:hypothetical protein DL769_001940 [Monosporascus sp. CRB-8-3]|nr:hypothetical protein DL769_001940 [Monosporascus sp. CRB-8-3]
MKSPLLLSRNDQDAERGDQSQLADEEQLLRADDHYNRMANIAANPPCERPLRASILSKIKSTASASKEEEKKNKEKEEKGEKKNAESAEHASAVGTSVSVSATAAASVPALAPTLPPVTEFFPVTQYFPITKHPPLTSRQGTAPEATRSLLEHGAVALIDEQSPPGDDAPLDGILGRPSARSGGLRMVGRAFSITSALHHTQKTISAKSPFLKQIIEMFVSRGLSLHLRDGDGRTPLHIAAAVRQDSQSYKRTTKLIDILVFAGVDTRSQNNEGVTPPMLSPAGFDDGDGTTPVRRLCNSMVRMATSSWQEDVNMVHALDMLRTMEKEIFDGLRTVFTPKIERFRPPAMRTRVRLILTTTLSTLMEDDGDGDGDEGDGDEDAEPIDLIQKVEKSGIPAKAEVEKVFIESPVAPLPLTHLGIPADFARDHGYDGRDPVPSILRETRSSRARALLPYERGSTVDATVDAALKALEGPYLRPPADGRELNWAALFDQGSAHT